MCDLSKPGAMGDMMAVNGRMHAFTTDLVEVREKYRHLVHGEEGGISENGVFIVESLSSSPEESTKIASNFELAEVTNRNDSDTLNCSRMTELIAARWRAGDPNIRFYKSKNKPDPLKLKSGRRFDHAFYFYDTAAKRGRLELSYGTAAEVRAAETALEVYMTPKKPPAETLARATAGNAGAQFELAKFFQKNNKMNRGVPYSSVDWYQKAALQNHREAQFELGTIYLQNFVPSEQVEGMKWLTAAARAGHASAQSKLASYLLNSPNKADQLTGQEMLTKSAGTGNSRALLSLAYASKNTNEAIDLLKKAYATDPSESKDAIPLLVQKLQSVGRSEEAVHYLQVGADNGDNNLRIELSVFMDRQGNYKEAVKYSKLACESMTPHIELFGPNVGQPEMDKAKRLEQANDLKQAASLYREAFSLNAQACSQSF